MDDWRSVVEKPNDAQVQRWANLEAKSDAMAEELLLNESPTAKNNSNQRYAICFGIGISLILISCLIALSFRSCNISADNYVEPNSKTVFFGPKYSLQVSLR